MSQRQREAGRSRPARNRPASESVVLTLSMAFELNASDPIAGMAAVLLSIRRVCGPDVLIRVRSGSPIVEVLDRG